MIETLRISKTVGSGSAKHRVHLTVKVHSSPGSARADAHVPGRYWKDGKRRLIQGGGVEPNLAIENLWYWILRNGNLKT